MTVIVSSPVMWLSSPGKALIGKFRYFNSEDVAFNVVGRYIAWTHITRVLPIPGTAHGTIISNTEQGGGANNSSTSETLTDVSHYDVCGDIIQVVPCAEDEEKIVLAPSNASAGAYLRMPFLTQADFAGLYVVDAVEEGIDDDVLDLENPPPSN
ncbi:hypothetical protein BC827DRAFT_1375705 [Russula dissimulans]|nr:hypothetical protein BC827DRAFT_1375705 [Russula dissimulans]